MFSDDKSKECTLDVPPDSVACNCSLSTTDLLAATKFLLRKLEICGDLPLWKGRVNRKTLERMLNVPRHSTYQNHAVRSFLIEYDSILRAANVPISRYEGLDKKVDLWLTEHGRNRTLITHDGRIQRQWVFKHFMISSDVLVRYPLIKQVILKHDALISGKVSSSRRYPDLLEGLTRILNRPNLPVYQGRLHLAAVARELGVHLSALGFVAGCAEVIREAQKRLQTSLPFTPLCVKHNRRYDFSDLVGGYGSEFTHRLAARFVEVISAYARGTAKYLYLGLLDLLKWLAETTPSSPLLAAAKINTPLDASDMRREAWRWRDAVLARTGNVTSRSNRITSVARITSMLAPVLPSTGELAPIRYARRKASPKKSLAEANGREDIVRVANLVVGFAQQQKVDVNSQELVGFLTALIVSNASIDSAVDLVTQIRILNCRRLDHIRACVETLFQKESAKLEEGQRLMANCDQTIQEIEALMDDVLAGKLSKAKAQEYFSAPFGIGLARYLIYVRARFDGLIPRSSRETLERHKQFFVTITSALGGPDEVAAHLHLSTKGVTAACLLLLIDSGANGAVVRGLRSDCLRASEIPGCRSVVGWKDRAGGKAVINDLPVTQSHVQVTAVRALEITEGGTQILRKHASRAKCNLLFLVRSRRDEIKAVSEPMLLREFQRTFGGAPELANIGATVDMIRPSVLLNLALSHDGNIRVAQAAAHHANIATTDGYTRKYPVKMLYEAKMREFQKIFQATAIAEVTGAAQSLNLDPAKATAYAKQAQATGLGTLCLSPLAGIQAGTAPGIVCSRVEACSTCTARALILDPELISDLLIWRDALLAAREQWESTRPDRWETYWLPWLAFAEAAVENLTRGPAARVLEQARKIAAKRQADPLFVAPTPF